MGRRTRRDQLSVRFDMQSSHQLKPQIANEMQLDITSLGSFAGENLPKACIGRDIGIGLIELDQLAPISGRKKIESEKK